MILTVTGRTIEFPRRPLIMGIVNINDDSFAGDGSLEIERAVATAQAHVLFGADIIDVGGESARTNRSQIGEDEEVARILPFINRFRECYAGKAPVDGYFPLCYRSIPGGRKLLRLHFGMVATY